MMRSSDGQLELMTVNLKVASLAGGAGDAVAALRDRLAQGPPAGLQAHVTGSAGISVDYMDAIQKGTDSTTIVTIVLVLVILLLIYRAPLAALVPLVTIGAAFLVSRGVLGTSPRPAGRSRHSSTRSSWCWCSASAPTTRSS